MTDALATIRQLLSTEAPRTVGEVVSINNDGTTTVDLLDGSRVVILGDTGTPGDRVYIERGRSVGVASSLPFYQVEV